MQKYIGPGADNKKPMSEYEIASRVRDVLRGLTLEWGPHIPLRGLKDLYAPQQIRPFSPTPGGIDNLSLSSTDTFLIPGIGELKAEFKGYFRVARENPTTNEWATAETYVNMIDIFLEGQAPGVGPITVTINRDRVSPGQVLAAGSANKGAACRIAVAANFDMPGVSTVFNKEPILLMNDSIKSIPPVEDPNGAAHIYKLPLYSRMNPEGRPIAYITSLKYTVGNYITKEQAEGFRARAKDYRE